MNSIIKFLLRFVKPVMSMDAETDSAIYWICTKTLFGKKYVISSGSIPHNDWSVAKWHQMVDSHKAKQA